MSWLCSLCRYANGAKAWASPLGGALKDAVGRLSSLAARGYWSCQCRLPGWRGMVILAAIEALRMACLALKLRACSGSFACKVVAPTLNQNVEITRRTMSLIFVLT